MRRHNLALVLGEIAGGEPVSRAGVAARTGLTRGTVSSLVEELLAAGLVTELAAARGTPGRPASPLQLNRSGPAGLGIEIGVDHVSACVVDLSGAVRARRTVASDHRDDVPSAGLATATALAGEVTAEAGLPVAGATVALPGVVGADGVLERAPNLPRWVDVAVGDELGVRLDGLPVRAGNEADLAALAELRTGGPADAVYVSGGIGVGAGILLGGALFRGAGGRAGEIGHVVVEPDGPACSCGGRGCLETAAGLEALLRAAGTPDVDALLAARPGPPLARAGRALGVALAGAVNLLDVPSVVLGGIYPRCGEPLIDAVRTELAARVVSRPAVDVRFSALGPDAALLGAATAVVHDLLARP
ncbi:ROK family transcriptional regulator [Pseudonocardia nigra]|uniref:ROK family transcriptional regulator n=1 Tax=Pseudonocardia nigra TaxID=1921578 RepID=UPI001C5EB1A9|nr:ROK family transcriptional regulator [Pseudonocardia nigra]